jgi:AcrR family transcriptional regulator
MSPANIYRFFSSKAEIHQALARRMLAAQFEALAANAATSASASERLKNHLLIQHRITVDTMMDEQKVHEMVLVALDQQWAVIEEHLQKVRELVSQMISAGIEAGEFREQNVQLAAECFMCCGVSCCHPQLVNKKISSDEIVRPEDLAEFAIRALR